MPKAIIVDDPDRRHFTVPVVVEDSHNSNPVIVDGYNSKAWVLIVDSQPHNPSPDGSQAKDSIATAWREAVRVISNLGSASFPSLLLKSPIPWWGWASASVGVMGLAILCLEEKTIRGKVFLWGEVLPSFSGPLIGVLLAYWWLSFLLCLILVFVGLYYSPSLILALRVRKTLRTPPPDFVPPRTDVQGRDDYVFVGPSLGVALVLAAVDDLFSRVSKIFQRSRWLNRISRWLLTPGWLKKLRGYGPGRVAVSAGIQKDGRFSGVGDWKQKLWAILDDKDSHLVICAFDDREDVEREWNQFAEQGLVKTRELIWKPPNWWRLQSWGWREADCRDNHDSHLTFVACRNFRSLINYLDPQESSFRAVARIVIPFTFILLLPGVLFSPCLDPRLDVSFEGKALYFAGTVGIPQVMMAPGEEVLMVLQAVGCEKETGVALEVEANAPVLGLATQGEPVERRSKRITCRQPEEATLKEATKELFSEPITVRMPPQREDVFLTVRVAPTDRCREGDKREYRLVRTESLPWTGRV